MLVLVQNTRSISVFMENYCAVEKWAENIYQCHFLLKDSIWFLSKSISPLKTFKGRNAFTCTILLWVPQKSAMYLWIDNVLPTRHNLPRHKLDVLTEDHCFFSGTKIAADSQVTICIFFAWKQHVKHALKRSNFFLTVDCRWSLTSQLDLHMQWFHPARRLKSSRQFPWESLEIGQLQWNLGQLYQRS